MNKSIPFGIAFLATAVLSAAGFFILPSLQSSKRTVDHEASIEIERARRLLHQYDAGLNYKSLTSDQLVSYVDEIDTGDMSEDLEDEYQRLHETLWAAYPPMDWDSGRPTKANYGNLPRQIGDGKGGQSAAAAQNERYLDQALSAVDRAIAVSSGDESARTHPEANRLKAVAQYHKGLTRWMEAQVLRREADQFRRELTGLAGTAADARAASARLADNTIATDIDDLQSVVDDLESDIDDHRSDAEEAEDTIAELEERLADAISRRDAARHAIGRLKAYGTDPSDTHGASRFRDELTTLGKAFREAEREAGAIEHGTYVTAELEYSGSYLTGRYVENGSQGDPEIRLGLTHYRDRQRILTTTIEREEQRLDDVRNSIAQIEGLRDGIASEDVRNAKQIQRAVETGADAFAELASIETDAFDIEEDALDLLDRAAASAKSAAGYAKRWVSDARNRTEGLSPEAKGRSAFDKRTRDGWVEAYIATQEADARLAKAWIYYARYRAAAQNARTLAKVAQVLQLADADAQVEEDKSQHAHDVGVAEITQAMEVLQRSHRATGKHWTLTAQAASTTYLLALFGHEDYVADTIETYRSAVTGRENDDFAATFTTRLSKLEGR